MFTPVYALSPQVDYLEYESDDDNYNWINPRFHEESRILRDHQIHQLRKDVVCKLEKPETCGLDKTITLQIHNQSERRNQALRIPNYNLLELHDSSNASWTRYGDEIIIPLEAQHTRIMLKTRLLGQEAIKVKTMDFSCLDIQQEVDLGVVTVVQ